MYLGRFLAAEGAVAEWCAPLPKNLAGGRVESREKAVGDQVETRFESRSREAEGEI